MTGYEKAFREGEAAYEAGQPGAEANPYRPGRDEALGWRAGWVRARDRAELEYSTDEGISLAVFPDYDEEEGALARPSEALPEVPVSAGPWTYGYARVSAADQNPALQLEALARAGVAEVVQEQASGARARPVLAALLARLQPGDTLAVWRLDRLGRSAKDLLLTLDDLRQRGVVVRSLTEGLDTSTSTGRAVAGILTFLAELERDVLRERQAAGIAVARREGRHGRPRSWDPEQVRHAATMVAEGVSLRQAARRVGLPKSTLAEALGRMSPAVPG